MKAIKWKVKGMHCFGCASSVKILLDTLGMEEIDLDFGSGLLVFNNATKESEDNIIAEIENLGYSVTKPD